MKRIFFAIILFAFLYSNSNAQISINGNVGLSMPLGTFSDVTTIGFGGSFGGLYQINPEMRVGLSLGYYGFFGSNISVMNATVKAPGWSIIPISGTYNYTFYNYNDFNFYGGFDLSLYLCRIRIVGSTIEPHFGIAPYIGATYNLNEWLKLNANLKYNVIFTSSQIMYLGINIGAEMPLNKIIGIFNNSKNVNNTQLSK